jgi:ribosomal protein L24E
MAKKTKILIHPTTGEERVFDADHADRILAHPLNNRKLRWTEKKEKAKKADAGNSEDKGTD